MLFWTLSVSNPQKSCIFEGHNPIEPSFINTLSNDAIAILSLCKCIQLFEIDIELTDLQTIESNIILQMKRWNKIECVAYTCDNKTQITSW